MMNTGTGRDILCAYCGRPVIGTIQWGAQGPYHPECCQPPKPIPHSTEFGDINSALSDLFRRIEILEKAREQKP